MKILIAHSKDDRNIHDNCKRMIERTSPHWTLDHYVVDEGDSAEPNDNDKHKLNSSDYFVLVYTRRTAGNYFGDGSKVRKLLKPGCRAVVYRLENFKRPRGFDDFEHLEGLFQLEDYFRQQYAAHQELIRGKAKKDKISAVFKKTLAADGIIYLAYYFFTTQFVREDLFEDSTVPGDNKPPTDMLSAFMRAKQFTPARLREVYDDIFEVCLRHEVTAENLLNKAEQGDLVRTVLDVKTGAFYLNEIQGSHYVCGVTVNQYRVYDMEHVMKSVCDELEQIENLGY